VSNEPSTALHADGASFTGDAEIGQVVESEDAVMLLGEDANGFIDVIAHGRRLKPPGVTLIRPPGGCVAATCITRTSDATS
jgi:hypothetical protein